MRILYILPRPFGLLGNNASYMVPSIAKGLCDVRVVAFEANEIERKQIVYKDPALDCIHYSRVPVMLRMSYVLDEIERFKADVVHQFYQMYSLLFPFYAKCLLKTPPKWIIDVRSPHLGERNEDFAKELARNALVESYCEVIMAHAVPSARELIPTRAEIVPAPPGISTSRFKSRDLEAIRPIRKFLYVGTLSKHRQLDRLVRFFAALRARSRHLLTLDLFGAGNGSNLIQDVIDENGLQGVVRLRGVVDQEVLFERLCQYDVGICFIPGGVYEHAPALKFYEYAAAGLPVFATNTPGLVEHSEGIAAEYFSDDAESFCNVLMPWTETAYPIERLEANRRNAQSLDWTNVVAQTYVPVYERLAAVAEPHSGAK
jgi:glycosyltransferase involved in cell wall biosynthesis